MSIGDLINHTTRVAFDGEEWVVMGQAYCDFDGEYISLDPGRGKTQIEALKNFLETNMHTFYEV